MRTDEMGCECPSTLAEYRDFVVMLVGEGAASRLLDAKIAVAGRDEPVTAADSQMRALLFPLMADDSRKRATARGAGRS